jgi:hypothetical protein
MRHMLILSVLLLGVSWAVAQDSSQSSPSGAQSGAAGQAASGSHTTVEGCVGGADGKYTLTDKQGTTYNLTGDTSKLAEHVGHEVKITGNTGSGSATAGGASAGGSTLEVASVKHVSKTCQSSGAMSK